MAEPTRVAAKRPWMDPNILAAAKKRREDHDEMLAHARDWSSQPSSQQAIHFTLKCTFQGLQPFSRNYLKEHRVGELREMLQKRGLSTEGTKPVLVERLYTTLPWVRFEIDGRECLQRIVNAFLFYFGWDNTHGWSMRMPRRGEMKEGTSPILERYTHTRMWLEKQIETQGHDLRQWNASSLQYAHQLLDNKFTRTQQQNLVENLDAPGPIRCVEGSAFEPVCITTFDPEVPLEQSGLFSLNDLCLQAGDKMHITYDFGDDHRFNILIEKVELCSTLLPEVALSRYPDSQLTRSRLTGRGDCRMIPQYEPPEEDDSDDDEEDESVYFIRTNGCAVFDWSRYKGE